MMIYKFFLIGHLFILCLQSTYFVFTIDRRNGIMVATVYMDRIFGKVEYYDNGTRFKRSIGVLETDMVRKFIFP